MDNDQGGTSDKRSWRERLGIGTKEMPKISDDFKGGVATTSTIAGQTTSIGAGVTSIGQNTSHVRVSAPRVTSTTVKTNANERPAIKLRETNVVQSAPVETVKRAEPVKHDPAPSVGTARKAPHITHVTDASRLEPTVTRRVVSTPAVSTQAPVRAAPLPPVTRAAPPPPPAKAAVIEDGLAEKLRIQREAAEKLAEQRVQAARERVEVKAPEPPRGKPKFVFADEDPTPPPPPPPAPKTRTPLPPRPTPKAPVVAKPIAPPPMPTPRAPLGAGGYVPPPRMPAPPPPPVQYPNYNQPVPPLPQAGFGMPAGYQMPPAHGYRQMPQPPQMPPPQYRPMEQHSYAPPPPPFAPPPMRPAPPPMPQQRMQPPPPRPAPQQPPPVEYQDEQAYAPLPEQAPPPPPMQAPPPTGFNRPMGRSMRPPQPQFQQPGEVFEAPTRRRATAGDYGQAYRELETGFDDEPTSGRSPWLLMALLGLALLVAGGSVFAYNKFVRPQTPIDTIGSAPEVEPPPVPTKEPPVAQAETGPSKKLIYDRIVGEREVLGNNLTPNEETPIQPEANTTVDPPAEGAVGQDGQPLPVPPPPGENGTVGDQGSLNIPSSETSTAQNTSIDPAAGESQAAVAPSDTGKSDQSASVNSSMAAEPVSTEPAQVETVTDVAANGSAPTELKPQPGTSSAAATEAAPEEIRDEPPVAAPKPAGKPRPKKLRTAKQQAQTKTASLGARPVVLVPASRAAKRQASLASNEETVAAAPRRRRATNDNSGGIYGEDFTSADNGSSLNGAPLVTEEVVPGVQPKKKTLLGSFLGDDVATATQVPKAQNRKPLFEQDAPVAPAPNQKVASASTGGSGYVAQLASFLSQSDATKAFGQLRAKYPGIIGGYRPVITTASVAGSTRYRLAVGPLASQSAADGVCARLLAAGERDCLAKRQ